MKNFLIYFGLALILASCSESIPKDAIIAGKLENQPDNYGLLISKGLTDTILINGDGSFL